MWQGSARSVPRIVLGLILCIAGLSGPGVADAAGGSVPSNADAKGAEFVQSCVAAHLSGQELRQDGHLLESRTQLQACALDRCPEIVRGECLRLLDELRVQVPTVVFRITVDGESRSDVAAFIGNRKLFSEIPSRAMEFDPGKYRFRFQYGKLAPIERDITIAEGERFLPIAISFEDPERTASKSDKVKREPLSDSMPAAMERRPVSWPVYVLAGVGVVGLGGFAGLGLATRNRENELKSSCSPRCTEEQINSVNTRALLADISLGVGAAAFALAATLYILRPTETISVGAVALPSGTLQTRLDIAF